MVKIAYSADNSGVWRYEVGTTNDGVELKRNVILVNATHKHIKLSVSATPASSHARESHKLELQMCNAETKPTIPTTSSQQP